MKYQVEHEKRNSISQAAISYSFLYIQKKKTNDEFFDGFTKISEHFRKISEDTPKVDESPDNRFRTFPNIFEDCQRFPK